MKEIEIVPTCIPESVEDVLKYGGRGAEIAPAIHLDIDDGVFTPEFSWPYEEKGRAGHLDSELFRDVTFDAHLMVSDCREIGNIFIQAGARSVIGHIESADMNTETLNGWQRLGMHRIGLAILIETPLENLNPLLPFCDFVHVMSVATIGAQGALFDHRALARVTTLHQNHPDLPLQVDGGVSRANIQELVRAGATRFAVGSAITTSPNPAEEYAALLSLAQSS